MCRGECGDPGGARFGIIEEYGVLQRHILDLFKDFCVRQFLRIFRNRLDDVAFVDDPFQTGIAEGNSAEISVSQQETISPQITGSTADAGYFLFKFHDQNDSKMRMVVILPDRGDRKE